MAVYDFDGELGDDLGGGGGGAAAAGGGGGGGAVDAMEQLESKERVMKMTAKKSTQQVAGGFPHLNLLRNKIFEIVYFLQVTQHHMCNYCNYTSPKRYLLSRHMKSHSEVTFMIHCIYLLKHMEIPCESSGI